MRSERLLSIAASALVVALAIPACGCSSSRSSASAPAPALSKDLVVQEEYRKLLRDFVGGSHADRLAMESSLTAFTAKHPNDGTARATTSLLAWIAMEKGDLARADALAIRAQWFGAGPVADLGRFVQGATQRRRGNPAAALEMLGPLVSKMIDPWARDLFNEEITMAAVGAKQPRRALELMAIWLREASAEDVDDTSLRIRSLLDGISLEEQVALLERQATSESTEAKISLRRIVALRLADTALDAKDSKLAARVIVLAGGLLGARGDAVAQLAAGKSRARIEAKTIGLLLSLRNPELRQRGIEVAAGVAAGLGLPAPDPKAKAPTLVSRDDAGALERVSDAVGELSADGAAIVIAGVDADESDAVAKAASAAGLATILLRPPRAQPASDGFVFLLGPDPSDVEQALTATLAARGATPMLLLSDAPSAQATEVSGLVTRRCDAPVSAEPSKSAPASIVVGPSEACAHGLSAFAVTPKTRFGTSFEGFGLPATSGSVIASAGLFPVDASSPPAAMRAWMDARRAAPTFWNALGRDAGMLAGRALEGLEERGTEDPKEVANRRARARDALAKVEGDLWTTDARGFAGARVMKRTIKIEDASAPARR